MASLNDNAGVIFPPPLIFLSGLLSGGVIGWFYPYPFLPKFVGYVVGGIFVVFGLSIIYIARAKMAKAETNIEPWKPTTAILSDGIYGLSRNPVYVAMIFIYLGVAFIFNSLWILPPLILVLFAMHYGVILREEKYLESKFGEEYLNYKNEVRRWI
jgi:protein-S-isoprenylcysteine O-methyltransferase Ste14